MSTETQLKGDSLRRQLDASQAYADQHGLDLVQSIRDIGVSAYKGKNVQQGALADFIRAIEEGVIERGSVLLIESFDRLSRDEALPAFNLFASIISKGLKIVTLADGQTYTSESVNKNNGQLFMSLGIMMRANEESETKSKRLKATWQQKRKSLSSKKLTSVCPAWLKYNEDSGQFEALSNSAVNTITTIFDLCIEQEMGAYTITRYLNKYINTYPPLGKSASWQTSYVSKILSNPSVYGHFQPRKRVAGARVAEGNAIEDYFPEIINKERYLLAQAKSKARNRYGGGRQGERFPNLFTKLLKCGCCGSTVTSFEKGSSSKSARYLQCRGYRDGNNCHCVAWRYDQFEESFLRFITEVDYAEILNGGDQGSKRKKLSNERLMLERSNETSQAEYETLRKRIADPNMPPALLPDFLNDLAKRKQMIDADHSRINGINIDLAALDAVSAGQTQQEILSAITGMSQSLGDEERIKFRRQIHSAIRSVVDEVKIHNYDTINPWEWDELISPKLLADLKKRGYSTAEKIEELLNTDHGKRLVNESTRYFIVRFRSGAAKLVWPYENLTLNNQQDRLKAMVSNVEKRRAQQKGVVNQDNTEATE